VVGFTFGNAANASRPTTASPAIAATSASTRALGRERSYHAKPAARTTAREHATKVVGLLTDNGADLFLGIEPRHLISHRLRFSRLYREIEFERRKIRVARLHVVFPGRKSDDARRDEPGPTYRLAVGLADDGIDRRPGSHLKHHSRR